VQDIIEPNCDMPWDIYLDWLQDQGYEDLRFICAASLSSPFEFILYHTMNGNVSNAQGHQIRFFNTVEINFFDTLYGGGDRMSYLNSNNMYGDGSF